MVSIAAVDDIRVLALESKSSLPLLRRASSLKIQMETEVVPVADISVSGDASGDEEAATASSSEYVTSTVSNQTFRFEKDFIQNLAKLFDEHQAFSSCTDTKCVKCSGPLDRQSVFSMNVFHTGCGHDHSYTCRSCLLNVLDRVGRETVNCEIYGCNGHLTVNKWIIDNQITGVVDSSSTTPEAEEARKRFSSAAFKRDWETYKERMALFDIDVFYCCICGDRKSREHDRLPKMEGSVCDHDYNTCKGCITASIAAQFEDKMWDSITCPECMHPIDHEIVRMVCSPEQFAK
jgi:hypothetical protein